MPPHVLLLEALETHRLDTDAIVKAAEAHGKAEGANAKVSVGLYKWTKGG